MMRMLKLIPVLAALAMFGVLFDHGVVQAVGLGEHMQEMEKTKEKKLKELSRLEELEKIVADEIASAKAEMAQNMSNTVQNVGRSKKNPEGLVTTTGGVVHSPKQNWVLDKERLRKEYENTGIYTADEIDTIVEFHDAYTQNRGFTAGIAEQLARVAEAKAQQRTIQKYIAVKKQEIRELENALQGSSSGTVSSGGSGGDGGGGGGGGGY